MLIFHCFTLTILFSINSFLMKRLRILGCLNNTVCQLVLKYVAKFYYYYILDVHVLARRYMQRQLLRTCIDLQVPLLCFSGPVSGSPIAVLPVARSDVPSPSSSAGTCPLHCSSGTHVYSWNCKERGVDLTTVRPSSGNCLKLQTPAIVVLKTNERTPNNS